MEPVLVTSYVGPDLDGAACAVAYGEFLVETGRDASARIIGTLDDETRYVLDRFSFEYPPVLLDGNSFNKIVLVDASNPLGLEKEIQIEKVIEIIDHRDVHKANMFPNAKVQIELVGAAATLIAERFAQSQIEISKKSATLLLGAIISNTLNFKGTVTTGRDKEMAIWLNKTAELSENFWKELFLAKSDLSGKKLVDRIEGDFTLFVMEDKRIGIAQIEMIGVERLVEERSDEIIQLLEEMKKEMNLDFIFQNTIELEDVKNFFITGDSQTQKLLEKVLNMQFVGPVAVRSDILLRKQIVPMLKEELE